MAALLQRLGLLSQVLQASGAPARTEPAEEAHTALRAQLAAAQAAKDTSGLAQVHPLVCARCYGEPVLAGACGLCHVA